MDPSNLISYKRNVDIFIGYIHIFEKAIFIYI